MSDCIFLLLEAILEARYIVRGMRKWTNQRLHAAFFDFKGAFDGIPRDDLAKMYMRFRIRGELHRIIIELCTNSTGLVSLCQDVVHSKIYHLFWSASG